MIPELERKGGYIDGVYEQNSNIFFVVFSQYVCGFDWRVGDDILPAKTFSLLAQSDNVFLGYWNLDVYWQTTCANGRDSKTDDIHTDVYGTVSICVEFGDVMEHCILVAGTVCSDGILCTAKCL